MLTGCKANDALCAATLVGCAKLLVGYGRLMVIEFVVQPTLSWHISGDAMSQAACCMYSFGMRASSHTRHGQLLSREYPAITASVSTISQPTSQHNVRCGPDGRENICLAGPFPCSIVAIEPSY